VARARRAGRQACPDHRRPISPAQQAAHRQQHMRDPAALAPRPAGTQPPADPALTRTTRSRECPQPARRPEQPGQRNRPAASRRSTTPAITPTVTIGASVHLARPSRHLGQEKDGRAAAYPNLITVASHTKKGNPAGLPSRPSSPQTTKLFQPITMLRLSRYATAKNAVVYGLQAEGSAQPRARPDRRGVTAVQRRHVG